MVHCRHMGRLQRFLDRFGPGFITGASDNDPSGIVTYTQVGAHFGLAQLWTAVFCLPFMGVMQEMVARIGMVTGEGLVASLRKDYPKWIMWSFVGLLFGANTLNIGADLGAMADASRLLIPAIPFPVLVVSFTVLILLLEIFITYKTYAKILKWFAFSLFGYIITAFLVTTDWGNVLAHSFIPTIQINRDFMMGLVAILGTTISPYLFIWQSNEQVEEEIAKGRTTLRQRQGATKQELKAMRKDVSTGMLFSQVITFCIMITASAVFFSRGIDGITSASQAAKMLEPIAGNFSYILYAVGIIGTGLLAVPVLSASASYAMSDALGIRSGLFHKLKQAHGFYGAITVSTLIGLLINFLNLNHISVLYWTAVINGLVMAPLIGIILVIANDKRVMRGWHNGDLANLIGLISFFVMTCAAVMFLVL